MACFLETHKLLVPSLYHLFFKLTLQRLPVLLNQVFHSDVDSVPSLHPGTI
jgi:hypothetical protein